jgi:hypothetical protein
MAQEPNPLVEDAHVEPGGAVSVLDGHRQQAEAQRVGEDQQSHRQVGEGAAAPVLAPQGQPPLI